MKMCRNVLLVLFLGIVLACAAPKATWAAVNADGSVTINEENFPDERFRFIASEYDTNKDNRLSFAERSVLKELQIQHIIDDDPLYYAIRADYSLVESMWCGPGTTTPETFCVGWRSDWRSGSECMAVLSIKGIEYFPELRSYYVDGYEETEGSLKDNAKLEEVSIGTDIMYNGMHVWRLKCEDCSRMEQDFPMNQLKIIRFGAGFECRNFSLWGATELQELQIGVCDDYYVACHSKLENVDLSANKKLKKIRLQGVEVKTLDLRKNKKLQEINIGGDRYLYDFYKSGKKTGEMYTSADTKCNLKLPKNNSIKKLIYMTENNKLDLTSCKKLTYLQVHAGVQVKFARKWYDSYGKKKLVLYTRGTKVKKKIQKRTKKYIYIKTKEFKNHSPENDRSCSQPYLHG